MISKTIKILLHCIYWFVFLAFSLTLSYRIDKGWEFLFSYFYAFVFNVLWAASTFYAFYYYFLPYFFEKRKYFTYLIISIIFSVSITSFFVAILRTIYPDFPFQSVLNIFSSSFGTFIIAQCGSLVRGFIIWFNNLQSKTEIERQNLQNELALLRAQINPHFLFNTLNNIDSLIYKDQDKASAALIKLSEIMRYMIYDSNVEKVYLTEEIRHIQNIVELQQLRFKNKDYISCYTTGNFQNLLIAPLLFLPFVENAFKYASNQGIFPAISIFFNFSDNILIFECKNYFNSFENSSKIQSNKIGINNVKRRLELLYRNNYQLDINSENNLYRVLLSININAN